jgi:hypothetical protein
MKTSTFPLLALACGLSAAFFAFATATSAPENATAYRALRVARAALGAEALGRLVEVTGHDGVPQPYLWKIVLKEGANGSKEIDVADGKIVAQRTLSHPPEFTGVVKLQSLNVDSGSAFDAADIQSRKARVRFDSVNYTLHANAAGQPVWTLELFNQDGAGVGAMRLTATDGTVASIDGRLANAAGRPGEPLTAAGNAAPPSTAATTTTTTTVETTTVPPPPGAEPPPPAVHDVDVAPPPPSGTEGGFFTRAGRTLDHTQDNVARSIDTAQDNVARSLDTAHDNVVRGIDTAHAKVDQTLRATSAKLEQFFGGHSDPDKD